MRLCAHVLRCELLIWRISPCIYGLLKDPTGSGDAQAGSGAWFIENGRGQLKPKARALYRAPNDYALALIHRASIVLVSIDRSVYLSHVTVPRGLSIES